MQPRQIYPLQGLHLLVTRPIAQADPWARQLRALGAMVTVQPMLAIAPLADRASRSRITAIMRRFDQFDKAIFISQNAVAQGVKWLHRYWPQLPRKVEFFAIGASTALSLKAENVAVQCAGIAMNSEALLALASMQHINGQKTVIFRGLGGRTYLGDQLSRRGAAVEYCELYRRKLPSLQVHALPSAFYKAARSIPITTVHSGETLTNLATLVPPSQLAWLQQQPLLAPGERVAAMAARSGFTEVLIAQNATHKSMVEALYEWRQQNEKKYQR